MADSQIEQLETDFAGQIGAIYALIYEREYDYRDDTEITIGYFLSEEDARAAQERISSKPGFCEFPEGFSISRIVVGRVAGWDDGFFSEAGPPPKDKDGEYFDLPFWLSESQGAKSSKGS